MFLSIHGNLNSHSKLFKRKDDSIEENLYSDVKEKSSYRAQWSHLKKWYYINQQECKDICM